MRSCPAVLACLLLFAATLRAGDLGAVPSAALVRRLDSDSFTERGQAHAELKRRGAKAIDALRQGLAGLGPEARRRVLDLMRHVEDAELRDAVGKSSPVRVVRGDSPTLEIRPAPDRYLWAIDAVRIGQKPLRLAAMPAPVLLVDGAGKAVIPDGPWTAPWPAKEARAAAGTIDCRVLLHHPAVAIRDPLAAAKPAVGMRGVRMTVVTAEREGGTVHFTVRIAQMSDLLAAGPPDHAQRQRPGVIVMRSALAALLDGLELRDARDRPLARTSLERIADAGPGVLCRATFTEVPQDGKGTRLVLRAWVTVRVEAPFGKEPRTQ